MTVEPTDDLRLLPLISAARLSTYQTACAGDLTQAMRLYAWNIEASAAAWGGFCVLEVSLRNSINMQLESFTGRADWWSSLQVVLHAEQSDAISAASLGGASPGSVVASLTFGFWTSLLANRYHKALWVPAVHLAFPGYSGRRGALQQELESLRRLRNRIAHHEPVFNRDLAADHRSVLRVLGWISPAAQAWVEHDSRLPAVIAARPDAVSGKRSTFF